MMKLKDILLEIGEGTAKPYKYKLTRTESAPDFGDYFRLYEFVTDLGTHYEVSFTIEEDFSKDEPWEFMEIEFGVVDKGGDTDNKIVTNKGELFRVMATIVDITKSILKERKNIKQLVFTGAKNRGEDDQRRNKLYMAYIRKHVPNIKNIEDDGNEIRVDI